MSESVVWEVLDVGCDDETRQALPGQGSVTSLYEVVKLAYLQPSYAETQEPLSALPPAVCSAAWGLVCVALDRTLLLFAENCSTLQLELVMDDPIDTVLWLCSPTLLLITDRGGKVHCIHVPSQRLLLSRQLPVSSITGQPLFIGSCCQPVVDGTTSVLLLTNTGDAIRAGNLNVDRLLEALAERRVEDLQEVQAALTLQHTRLLARPAQVVCSGSVMGARDSDVWLWLACDDGRLLHYSPQQAGPAGGYDADALQSPEQAELLAQLSNSHYYTKIIPICNARYLVTLQENGVLGLTCVTSGFSVEYDTQPDEADVEEDQEEDDTPFSVKSPVVDVVVLPWTESSHTGDDVQLLMLVDNTASTNKTAPWLLRILSIPGLVCEYEVEVSGQSQLMPLGEGVEAMVFLEPELPPHQPAIKIKTIIDGIPEARLKKLVSKLKFREAAEFARHFGLNEEVVYKGRARHLTHLLSPYTSATSLHATNTTASNLEAAAESLLTELLEVLDSVSDMEFVSGLCIDATLPDIPVTQRVLNYAMKRLAKNTQNLDSERLSALSERVSQELYRLHTFSMLHVVDDVPIDQWLAFASADLLELFMEHLRKGELSIASSIWQRHQHEFQHSVDQECVNKILHLLPSMLPSSALVAWLPHNLTDLIRLCPHAIDTIACWALIRMKRLEIFEKSGWPDNALNLGHQVMAVLETVVAEFSEGGNIEVQMGLHLAQWKTHLSPSSSLYQLRHTLLALQELHTLVHQYRISIALDQYTQEDKGRVVYCLLEWLVCGEEVAPLVEGFIIPVLLRQGEVSADKLLADYVHETLANNNDNWFAWQEAHWEDKLYAIIAVIRDEQTRVRCLVSCVRMASVPWTADTTRLCQEGLDLLEAGGGSGGEREQLLEQRRLVTLKLVLRKHAMHHINFTDGSNAEMVLRTMSASDQEGVLTDMLQVVATYHHLVPSQAFMYRIFHLISQGSFDEASVVLKAVPADHLTDTCCQLLHYVQQTLHFAPRNDKMKERRCHLVAGVVSLQQLLLAGLADRDLARVQEDLMRLRTVNDIQRKFEMYPRLRDLQDQQQCLVLLQQHIEGWYDQHHHTLLLTHDNNKADSAASSAGTLQAPPPPAPSVLSDTSNVDRANKLSPKGGNTNRRVTRDNKENIIDDNNSTSLENEKNSAKGVSQDMKQQEDAEGVAGEEGSSGGWCVGHVMELCRLLGHQPVTALQTIAGLALDRGHLTVALAVVRLLNDEPVSSGTDLTSIVNGVLQLLVKQLQQGKSGDERSFTEESFGSEDDGGDGHSHEATAQLLRLALPTVTTALHSAHPGSLAWLSDVALWCGAGAALYQHCHQEGVYSHLQHDEQEGVGGVTTDPYSTWLYSPLYKDRGMPIHSNKVSAAVLQALNLCIQRYESSSVQNSFQSNCSSADESTDTEKLKELVSSLCSLADHAQHRSNDLTALMLRVRLAALVHLPSHNPEHLLPPFATTQVCSLTLKVINPKKTDVKLAVSLFTHFTLKESLKIMNELINRFGYDYGRLEALADIGVNLCAVHTQPELRIRFADLAKHAKWGRRLSELNVSFKESFGKHEAILHKLIDTIVLQPKCSYSLLKDFCTDFNLSLTDALLCYLKSLLSTFTPEPIRVCQEAEKWRIPEMPSHLLEQLVSIITKIDEKVLLQKMLFLQLEETMCYNYDSIQFLLEHLFQLHKEDGTEDTWQRGLDILQFLKGYERKSQPTVTEVEEWMLKVPTSTALPNIAWHRMPFTNLFQGGSKLIMNIINNELDVNTIDVWLRCSESLQLNQDQMCFVAVRNTVSRTLDKRVKRDSSIKWQLAHNHRGLLKEISTVILKIGHDKLAMACGKNVVRLLPSGIDKVESAKNCLLMAERWQRNCDTSESREAVSMFFSQHQQLAMEHALHKYGVAEPEYLKLLQDPHALITALYHHPSLASLATLATDKMPKINECVTEICEEVRCNQALIQRELLEKWLPPSDFSGGASSGADMDLTISNFQLNLLSPSSDSEAAAPSAEQASLSRVIYLLRGCDPDDVVSYLVECAESSSGTFSTAHRLRALKCLLAVADPHTLAKYVTVPKVKALLRTLSYVCRLEALGCPTDSEQLAAVDKSILAEGVWRSHRHNPHALLLIADLCIEYQVSKPSLWNAVLQQLASLVSSRGVEEAPVQALLLQLRQHPHLWLLPGLVAAWTKLIKLPFDTALLPLSSTALHRLIVSTGLLAQCPVSLPSLESLVATCTALHQPALAVVVAAAFTSQHSQLQELIDNAPKEELLKQFGVIKAKIPLPRLVENLLESNGLKLD